MKKRIVLYIVIAEIIIIATIGISIFNKFKHPKISVSPLNSDLLQFDPVNGLKYFYEPKANIDSTLDRGLLNDLGYSTQSGMIEYTINKDALNQASNYKEKKDPGVFRVVAIGDSFTFGSNVSTNDNYPSQLERKLNEECVSDKIKKFEVLNLGVEAYDLQYAVERYTIRGKKYKPDLVLWFLINNDFERIAEAQTLKLTLWIGDIGKKSGRRPTFQEMKDGAGKIVEDVIKDYGGIKKVLEFQRDNMLQLNKHFNKKLVIFTLDDTKYDYYKLMQDFAKLRKGTYAYSLLFNDSLRLRDGHPTSEGYKEIVDNLYTYLKSSKVITCKVNNKAKKE